MLHPPGLRGLSRLLGIDPEGRGFSESFCHAELAVQTTIVLVGDPPHLTRVSGQLLGLAGSLDELTFKYVSHVLPAFSVQSHFHERMLVRHGHLHRPRLPIEDHDVLLTFRAGHFHPRLVPFEIPIHVGYRTSLRMAGIHVQYTLKLSRVTHKGSEAKHETTDDERPTFSHTGYSWLQSTHNCGRSVAEAYQRR
ncbi:hypothetical protein NSPZN2_11149 [Nitrospira defluvii]|uniref:Uncharacterized protein n=1 Tax=Nitrospira defluvii TaxID=330214 RepID=A0ABM8QQB0_9BACT|nr:hypothetical protein NSPZN2_11149 [Nitrospira defluvii]